MQSGGIEGSTPWGLGLDEKILPQYLKPLGYKTHAVGKVGTKNIFLIRDLSDENTVFFLAYHRCVDDTNTENQQFHIHKNEFDTGLKNVRINKFEEIGKVSIVILNYNFYYC